MESGLKNSDASPTRQWLDFILRVKHDLPWASQRFYIPTFLYPSFIPPGWALEPLPPFPSRRGALSVALAPDIRNSQCQGQARLGSPNT